MVILHERSEFYFLCKQKRTTPFNGV